MSSGEAHTIWFPELKQFLKSKHLYDELIQKLKSNNKNAEIPRTTIETIHKAILFAK